MASVRPKNNSYSTRRDSRFNTFCRFLSSSSTNPPISIIKLKEVGIIFFVLNLDKYEGIMLKSCSNNSRDYVFIQNKDVWYRYQIRYQQLTILQSLEKFRIFLYSRQCLFTVQTKMLGLVFSIHYVCLLASGFLSTTANQKGDFRVWYYYCHYGKSSNRWLLPADDQTEIVEIRYKWEDYVAVFGTDKT